MIYGSIIITFFWKIYSVFYKYFEYSLTYRLIEKIWQKVKQMNEASIFVRVISREGSLSTMWTKSAFYKALDSIISFPTWVLRRVHFKSQQILAGSVFFNIVKFLLDNLHLVISFAFLAIIVIPHRYSYTSYMALVVFGILFALILKTGINKGYDISIKGWGIYLIIYILSVLLAVVFSLDRSISIADFSKYAICFAIVFIITGAIKSKYELSTFIEMVLIGVTITGLFGIWQKIQGVPINPSQIDMNLNEGVGGRVYSNMDNPNNFAQVLTLFIPYFLAVIVSAKTVLKKLIFIGFAAPVVVSLLLTSSRSAWIGTAVAFMVFLYFKEKKLIPFVIIGGLVLLPFLPNSVYIRLQTIFNPSDSSTSYRFLIMESVLPALRDFAITGVGLGANVFMRAMRGYPLATKAVPPHSHNLLLQIWIEVGLIGVLAFAGFLINTIKKGIKSLKKYKDTYLNDMTIAGISSLCGIMVISIAEHIWYYSRVMMLFWVVAALLITSIKMSMRKAEKKEV